MEKINSTCIGVEPASWLLADVSVLLGQVWEMINFDWINMYISFFKLFFI